MRTILLSIIAALLSTGTALALELTVEQCVSIGLNNNFALKAQEANVESSRQDARIAHAAFMPKLEAQGVYAALDQPTRYVIEKDLLGPGTPATDVEIRGDKDFYGAGLTMRQTLYAGGRITHAYQRDNELLTSARHEFDNRRTQLIYDLKKAFYETLIQQAYSDSYTQLVVASQEGLRVAKVMADEGQLGVNKFLEAQAQLRFSEAQLLQAQLGTANALDQLRRLLALDNAEELVLIDGPTYPSLKDATVDLSVSALEKREDLKQLDARIKAAEESLKVAQSRYHPEIYAQGGYLHQRETNITQQDSWGFSVNLNWVLFEGWKTDAEVVKSKTEMQRLENLRRDLTAEIYNEVQAGQRLAQQRQLLVEAYLTNLQVEERNYSDILGRQQEGEVTVADVYEQKSKLLLARANYLESIHQLRIAIADLEAVTASTLDGLLEHRDIYRAEPARLETALVKPETPNPSDNTPPVAPLRLPQESTPHTSSLSPPPLGANQHYVIQLGAFKSKARARVYLKSLKKRFPDKTFEITAANGLYKIRNSPFSSQAAAASALAEFDGKGFVVLTDSKR